MDLFGLLGAYIHNYEYFYLGADTQLLLVVVDLLALLSRHLGQFLIIDKRHCNDLLHALSAELEHATPAESSPSSCRPCNSLYISTLSC